MSEVAVVIDVSTEDPSEANARALVAACTRAVEPDRCALADAADASVQATVAWDAAHLQARIRVSTCRRSQPRSAPLQHERASRDDRRTLDFLPTDDVEQRWRTVGFVLGGLAAEVLVRNRAASGSPGAAPASSSKPAGPPRIPAVPTRAPERAMDLPGFASEAGAFAGFEPATGAARVGFTIAGRHGIGGQSPFGVLAFRYASGLGDSGGADLTWTGGAAGVGVRALVGSHAAVEARAAFVAERLNVSAFDPASGASAETGRFMVGGRVGLDVSFGTSRVSLVTGVEGAAVGGTTHVLLHGRRAAVVAPFVLGANLGIRLAIPTF